MKTTKKDLKKNSEKSKSKRQLKKKPNVSAKENPVIAHNMTSKQAVLNDLILFPVLFLGLFITFLFLATYNI